MTFDIFPKYRHLVVVANTRFPTRILSETPMGYHTTAGYFLKNTGRKFGDQAVTFIGPFSAEGDLEARP